MKQNVKNISIYNLKDTSVFLGLQTLTPCVKQSNNNAILQPDT
jgi:hypothetical protein